MTLFPEARDNGPTVCRFESPGCDIRAETVSVRRWWAGAGRWGLWAIAACALLWSTAVGLCGWRLWNEADTVARLQARGTICRRAAIPMAGPPWSLDVELGLGGPGLGGLGSGGPGSGPTVSVVKEVVWFPHVPGATPPAWSQLRELISLESLSWFQNPTSEDWRHLEALTALRQLHLRSVTLPPGVVARIARLPRLEELRLDDCRWPPGELATLIPARHLKVLQLDFSPVEEDELLSLAGLPRLRSLSLTGSGVSEAACRALLQHGPQIDLSDD